MKLQQVTFKGPPGDDPEILLNLPKSLRRLLEQINGFIQFAGGLHVRGASRQPPWHSLRWVWQGDEALHHRYSAVTVEDVPFGQDCVGDQFLLRQDSVIKLATETGEIEELNMPLMEFLEAVQSDPDRFLNLSPLIQFHEEGGVLLPGELLNVYPPFCMEESSEGVNLAAVRVEDRLAFLVDLSKQLERVPDGSQVEIDIRQKNDLDPGQATLD